MLVIGRGADDAGPVRPRTLGVRTADRAVRAIRSETRKTRPACAGRVSMRCEAAGYWM